MLKLLFYYISSPILYLMLVTAVIGITLEDDGNNPFLDEELKETGMFSDAEFESVSVGMLSSFVGYIQHQRRDVKESFIRKMEEGAWPELLPLIGHPTHDDGRRSNSSDSLHQQESPVFLKRFLQYALDKKDVVRDFLSEHFNSTSDRLPMNPVHGPNEQSSLAIISPRHSRRRGKGDPSSINREEMRCCDGAVTDSPSKSKGGSIILNIFELISNIFVKVVTELIVKKIVST